MARANALMKPRDNTQNLSVRDRPFDDFASSRNFALEHVTSEQVLVLDADERLTPGDFHNLARVLSTVSPYACLDLPVAFIGRDCETWERGNGHQPRVFPNHIGLLYKNTQGREAEYLFDGPRRMDWQVELIPTNVWIKHFIISEGTHFCKQTLRRQMMEGELPYSPKLLAFARKYNPKREEYY